MSTLKQFKRRALARPETMAAYEASTEEFARLESAEPQHFPSIATLQKYAKAPGFTVELRLVKERRLTTRSSGPASRAASRAGRRST